MNNQYQAGVINYLNVLTAQTSALNSERSLLDLRGRRLAASVALVKALGGGWQVPAEAASVNAAPAAAAPSEVAPNEPAPNEPAPGVPGTR